MFFEKDSENAFSPKMDEAKNYWHHHKALLKSLPMNGHVNMF
jgi:hypothetical protein